MDRIAGAHVRRKAILRVALGHEVDLVDDDVRRERVGFGDDEKSVEHPRVRLGAGGGEDDDHLIDIGGDDALAVRAAGGSTRQTRAPRQYVADGPPVAARIRFDDHFIADRELQSILATRRVT